jgi:hypothetical protein
MGDFSAAWLALREPADFSARSSQLADVIANALEPERIVQALDLASGTGSNVRYLAERLPPRQDWLLVDDDPELIAQAPARMSEWAAAHACETHVEPGGVMLQGDRLKCRVQVRRVDVADLTAAAIFHGRQLVTASALLDLVSEPWLRGLAVRCREHAAAVLFALNYDGRIHCLPEEAGDEHIRDLVNRHQQRDKGFGTALGPEAAATAERLFAAAGYQVQRQPSEWVLSPDELSLQQALIDGWAQAAAELAPAESVSIQDWRTRRLAHLERGRSRLRVGHQDVAAVKRVGELVSW